MAAITGRSNEVTVLEDTIEEKPEESFIDTPFQDTSEARPCGKIEEYCNSYEEAAAKAIVAYPILKINYGTVTCRNAPKKKYLKLLANKNAEIILYFIGDRLCGTMQSRLEAFKCVFRYYLELNKIQNAQILVEENIYDQSDHPTTNYYVNLLKYLYSKDHPRSNED